MIPLRATNAELSGRWPDRIILHHTACKVENAGEFSLDKPTFQSGRMQDVLFRREKQDSGFHYIIERVNEDFQIIVSQPLMTLCKYEDLDSDHWRDVHIALMGNYNKDLPANRLYRVLAYRLIVPLMRTFVMDDNDIVLHSAISKDINLTLERS